MASHENWRLFMLRKMDPRFAPFQNRIFLRDRHTCRFCGFRARLHMDVVNVDGNFLNNDLNNLVTACPFCAQCFFIESIGKDVYGSGLLIAFPEMQQNQLNALSHVMFCAIISGDLRATRARNIYRSLRLRAQQVEKFLGTGLSQPNLLGQLLVDSSERDRNDIHNQLKTSVRLLPDFLRFSEPVCDWIQDGLKELRQNEH